MYPFKVLHIADPNAEQHQVLVSIPRKNFKKAVTRNLIKRRVKEAYRLNKYLLADVTNTFPKLQIGYIYTAKEILPYQLIEAKLKKTLYRLIKVQASTLYSKKS